MLLIIEHPQVAYRDCGECQKWMYDDDTGQLKRMPDPETGQPTGPPIPRPAAVKTACQTARGCPKGTPENQRSLTPKNWRAYQHYRECSATGRFPDDSIVSRNAGIIAEAEQSVRDRRQWLITELLLTRSLSPI